jgi:hypothetical protein
VAPVVLVALAAVIAALELLLCARVLVLDDELSHASSNQPKSSTTEVTTSGRSTVTKRRVPRRWSVGLNLRRAA